MRDGRGKRGQVEMVFRTHGGKRVDARGNVKHEQRKAP
jgi:hypothetical protein